MTGPELELRRRILLAFAETGSPPILGAHERPLLRSLAAHHVVVLDALDRIRMAHPFAAHRSGARVEAGGRTWWGNCAWDAFGIAALLGLEHPTVTEHDVVAAGDALFHVQVPAALWWEDIGFT